MSELEGSSDAILKVELGMVPDAPLRKVELTGGHYGAKFRNYTIEIVGLEKAGSLKTERRNWLLPVLKEAGFKCFDPDAVGLQMIVIGAR